MMDQLTIADFVAKEPLWSIKSKCPLKQSLYRISDPYIRFYLKIIEPLRESIAKGGYEEIHLSTMPGFDAHLGLQFELLLLQNRRLFYPKLGISPMDVVRSGPYQQSKNASQKGCQIDYLIHTKTNTLFICEFKFKRREISTDIIIEMQEKLASLKVPKGYAKVAVLFHLSGVSAAVATSPDFYRIIDICDFLT